MFVKVICLALTVAAVQSATTKDDFGFRSVMRIYEDCQRSDGVFPCLKKKAILFFDRAARMENIPLVDGIEVVKTSEAEVGVTSEKDLEAALPRNYQDKDGALTEMLWDRVAAFANSRTIQLSLPKITGQQLGQGVEEGNELLRFSLYWTFHIH